MTNYRSHFKLCAGRMKTGLGFMVGLKYGGWGVPHLPTTRLAPDVAVISVIFDSKELPSSSLPAHGLHT